MSASRTRSLLAVSGPIVVVLLAALALGGARTARAAEPFPTDLDGAHAAWTKMFGDWTVDEAVKAGYEATDDCVTGPPDQGNMGRHFINMKAFSSGELDPETPHAVLFDMNDKVVAVEWEIDELRDPAPRVGPLELEFTPPHPGMDQDHMSRHVYFVGDAAHRFSTFNPAVACPAEASSMDDDHQDMAAPAPANMPTTGAGDLVPGGLTGLLALVVVALAAVGLAGRRAEARR